MIRSLHLFVSEPHNLTRDSARSDCSELLEISIRILYSDWEEVLYQISVQSPQGEAGKG
jgi:hypothetical protein